jgi:hypothetical protein
MSLTEAIISRAAMRKVRSQHFPQLGRTIHVAPWTCQERHQIIRAAQEHGFTSRYEIEVLLLKAIDQDGNKLFTPHDRTKLLVDGDPNLIGQISDFLIGPEVYADEVREVAALGEPSAPPKAPTSTTTST